MYGESWFVLKNKEAKMNNKKSILAVFALIAVIITAGCISESAPSEPLDPLSEECLAINLEYQTCVDDYCAGYNFDADHYDKCDAICSTGVKECEREWMWDQ